MPTNRRRITAQRRDHGGGESAALRELLLTGHWWEFLAVEGATAPTMERLRSIYQQNREAILERYDNTWAERAFDGDGLEPLDWRKHWIRSEADEVAVSNGCWFDSVAAERVCCFFERFLRLSKGEWGGQAFRLMDWQRYDVLMPLFGWKRADGTRRYRQTYIEIPKKNGKSPTCSGVGLYMLMGDGELGAEVYSAAADRDQAAIVFDESSKMANASNSLRDELVIYKSVKRIEYHRTHSIYKALSADVPTKEGLNISALLFDELHAQQKPDLWDTLQYGGRARRQPLLVSITTAGYDKTSICWAQHEYAEKVRDGIIHDDAFLPYIRIIDPDLDPYDPAVYSDRAVWAQANPSLGNTLKEGTLAEDARKAQEMPTALNQFLRYSLNIWTEQDVRWLPMDTWKQCHGSGAYIPWEAGTAWRAWQPQLNGAVRVPDALRNRPCYLGLDLATTTDIAAGVAVFPVGAGREHVWLSFFWVPADNAKKRQDKDRVPYLTWIQQGYIKATEGNVIDYDVIRVDIGQLGKLVKIEEIAIDRWNSTQLQTQLMDDGFTVVQFNQGIAGMSGPSKDIERRVLERTLHHGGHPVMYWMASNITVRTDANGNIKPDKEKSTEKIDGPIAGIMGSARAMVQNTTTSVYETRGVLTVG